MNKTKTTILSDEIVAAYRAFPPVDVANTVAALAAFLEHATMFQVLGDDRMAAAAERAWWHDAVLLAGEAASSADEARRKVAALDLAPRAWTTAAEHSRAAAMIAAAVEAERVRWGLAAATRH